MTCNSDFPDFSYDHYRSILLNLKERYKFSDFDNNSTNDVILRHDIDISLDYALRMAKIENELGVHATYFILFHAETYNPFNPHSTQTVKEILKLGHKIGLHYNLLYYENNNLDPVESILNEITAMEYHYNTNINVVAAHQPTKKYVALDLPKHIKSTYADEFTNDRKYLSESNRNWREGCICSQYDKYDKLQLLFHPIWWNEENLSRESVMDREFGDSTVYAKDLITWKKDVEHYMKYVV